MGDANLKRIVWLDYLRMFAIALVILAHAQDMNPFADRVAISSVENGVLRLFNIIGHTGVSMFLFLTGFLFLGRKYTKEKIWRFYKKKFCGLLVTTEIWFLVFYFVCYWWGVYPFDLNALIKLLTLSRDADISSFLHMWYLPMILHIYLFIPLIAVILSKIPKKLFFWLLSLYTLYVYVPNTLSALNHPLNSEFFSLFRFYNDGFFIYVLIGYAIKQEAFKHMDLRVVFVAAVLGAVGAFDILGRSIYIGCDNLTILLPSLFLTLLVKRFAPLTIGEFFRKIGENSFGMYLLHILVIWTLYLVLCIPIMEPVILHVLLIYPVIFIITFYLAEMIKKSGLLAKYLLYIR